MGDDGRVRRSLTPGGKEGEVVEERGLARKQSSVPAADGSATGAGRQQLTLEDDQRKSSVSLRVLTSPSATGGGGGSGHQEGGIRLNIAEVHAAEAAGTSGRRESDGRNEATTPMRSSRSGSLNQRRPFSPGPMPKPTAEASWCSIRRGHVRAIMEEHAPSEHDAHRFLACLRTKGFDNIYALKSVEAEPDELETLGIDQLIPRRRICKTLQHLALPPFPSSLLPLDRYLFALLEYEAPEDSALQNCLETLREAGVTGMEDLRLLPEEDLAALPLLEGHKLALAATKRQGGLGGRSASSSSIGGEEEAGEARRGSNRRTHDWDSKEG